MSYTGAQLALSKAAYDEIASTLRAAGYDQAFLDDNSIDMKGLAVVCEPEAVEAARAEPGIFQPPSYSLEKERELLQDEWQRLVATQRMASAAWGGPVDIWALQARVMAISGQQMPIGPSISMGTMTYLALIMEEFSETAGAVAAVLLDQGAAPTPERYSLAGFTNQLVSASIWAHAWSRDVRQRVKLAGPAGKADVIRIHKLDQAREVADGFTDLAVVVAGGAISSGLPAAACYQQVAISNVSKANPETGRIDLDESGKWIKGPNYQPPRIDEILAPMLPDGGPLETGDPDC